MSAQLAPIRAEHHTSTTIDTRHGGGSGARDSDGSGPVSGSDSESGSGGVGVRSASGFAQVNPHSRESLVNRGTDGDEGNDVLSELEHHHYGNNTSEDDGRRSGGSWLGLEDRLPRRTWCPRRLRILMRRYETLRKGGTGAGGKNEVQFVYLHWFSNHFLCNPQMERKYQEDSAERFLPRVKFGAWACVAFFAIYLIGTYAGDYNEPGFTTVKPEEWKAIAWRGAGLLGFVIAAICLQIQAMGIRWKWLITCGLTMMILGHIIGLGIKEKMESDMFLGNVTSMMDQIVESLAARNVTQGSNTTLMSPGDVELYYR